MDKLKHKHILIRADVKQPPKTTKEVIAWLIKLIKNIDMKILEGPFARRVDMAGNEGVTAMAIIETSHVVIHIWDACEPSLIQLDVYSCADFNPQDIFDKVNELFKTIKIEYKFLDREKELVEVNF